METVLLVRRIYGVMSDGRCVAGFRTGVLVKTVALQAPNPALLCKATGTSLGYMFRTLRPSGDNVTVKVRVKRGPTEVSRCLVTNRVLASPSMKPTVQEVKGASESCVQRLAVATDSAQPSTLAPDPHLPRMRLASNPRLKSVPISTQREEVIRDSDTSSTFGRSTSTSSTAACPAHDRRT